MTAYLIVNFGGPRTLSEIEPFLKTLLTDRDVVRTKLPRPLHDYLFKRVAKRRAVKIGPDYASIGGGSPIYADTEYVAQQLREKLEGPVLTFHRYLPATHAKTLSALEALEVEEIRVFPMFPQFTYATTGSIARFLHDRLSSQSVRKMKWVKSYPSHPEYIALLQTVIREQNFDPKETLLFFSAHGVPQQFVDEGDLYGYECRLTYEGVMGGLSGFASVLAFQSKFGPGEWLRPYTDEVCEQIERYREGRRSVVFVPMSFTSDHIETLYEVEQLYVPVIREQGLSARRLPAFNRRADWIEVIASILKNYTPTSTSMLIRSR